MARNTADEDEKKSRREQYVRHRAKGELCEECRTKLDPKNRYRDTQLCKGCAKRV